MSNIEIWKTIEKTNKSKSWFLEEINKIDQPSFSLLHRIPFYLLFFVTTLPSDLAASPLSSSCSSVPSQAPGLWRPPPLLTQQPHCPPSVLPPQETLPPTPPPFLMCPDPCPHLGFSLSVRASGTLTLTTQLLAQHLEFFFPSSYLSRFVLIYLSVCYLSALKCTSREKGVLVSYLPLYLNI